MIKKLIEIYEMLGIDVSDWNIAQLLFGERYIGLILLMLLLLLIFM